MSEPLRSDWIADPLIIDASFQMMILWGYEELGVVSLPSYVARYRQYRRRLPAEGVTAAMEVRHRSPHKLVGDFWFLDRSGEVVARMEGYEATADASLAQTFRKRTLPTEAGRIV